MIKAIRDILNNLFKLNKWWVYKIGSGVFTFALFKYFQCGSLQIDCLKVSDLLLFAVLLLLAVLGHFINDYSDYDSDQRAGKPNVFNKIGFRAAIPLLLITGLGSLWLTYCFLPFVVVLFVALQIFCCLLYSVKPFRLKEKGFASVVLTGIYERSLPYLIILLSVGAFSDEIACLSVIYIWWAYLWECRNFINGQVGDYEDDLKTGTRSVAIIVGLAQTGKVKFWVKILEICTLIAWLALLPIYCETIAFVVISLFIPLIHGLFNPESKLLGGHERFLDYLYNYGFLAGLLISLAGYGEMHLALALVLLFMFQSTYSTFWVICKKLQSIGLKIYYAIRYVVSKIVNYSIYYYRKYVLKWPESKSRGEKD